MITTTIITITISIIATAVAVVFGVLAFRRGGKKDHLDTLDANYQKRANEGNQRLNELNTNYQKRSDEGNQQIELLASNYQKRSNEGNQQIELLASDYQTQASNYQTQLNEQITQINERTTQINELNQQTNELTKELTTLNNKLTTATNKLTTTTNELTTATNELAQLNTRSRIALLENGRDVGELGMRFELTTKEKQLVAAINGLRKAAEEVGCQGGAELVNELMKLIGKLEWEKVWRPKIQVYRSELAGKQGIYKLTLVDDVEVCYVGQARNVYERGFEHAKKMIGVDGKGNEKLYEYGVGDFYWKVIEEVDDANKLNDAEKYWIEYWCCVERGLNKKK